MRVRYDPPTLDEAIFAAQGMTDDVDGQVEIAASLFDVSADEVVARMSVLKKPKPMERQIFSSRQGFSRAVVVERKPVRRFIRAG